MRALVLASMSVAALAGTAHADASFESLAQNAQVVRRLDDVIWALTAKCDGGNDVQQRQCRRIRDTRAAELKTATLLVDADREAFTIGAYSPQKKSAPVVLTACIRCGGVEVDGDDKKKLWFAAGTREANGAPRFQSGRQVGPTLSDNARTFPDAASAKKYADAFATAKIQFLLRVPAQPVWTDAGKQGIAFEVVGYRVYSPCDGAVVVSNPPSGPGEIDRRACAGIPASGEVESLTPAMIKESLRPVLDAAKACYGQHKTPGNGKLRMTIAGDGTLAEYALEGDFANTPTGDCIDAAAKQASFPRSKKPRTPVAMPIALP